MAKLFPTPLEGACRCGEIQYRVTSPPRFSFACHCTDCQQLTSSAFSMALVVDRPGFAVTKGLPRCWAKRGESGGESRQYTCPACAGWTHTEADTAAKLTIVRPSTLHEHGWFRPVAQIYTRSALPWALMPVQFSFETEFSDPTPLEQAFAAGGIRPDVGPDGPQQGRGVIASLFGH